MDKKTGKLVDGGVAAETQLALKNLKSVLLAADSDIDKVIKTTVFVQNLDEFSIVNEEYKKGMYIYIYFI